MSIGDKLLKVASNVTRVFAAGESKHLLRYFTDIKVGDSTNTMSFDMPFEPDAVLVVAHGADAVTTYNAVRQMFADFRSFWKSRGIYIVRQNGTFKFGNISSATLNNYFRIADGVCTVEVPAALGVPYANGAQYIVVAVKYTDKSDKELLEEEIALLADTGSTIEYSNARVLEAVTEEEWQTLIATKPNRTFTLV